MKKKLLDTPVARKINNGKLIACNASNSAAVNTETGKLQVWGAGKNGLLGKGDEELLVDRRHPDEYI